MEWIFKSAFIRHNEVVFYIYITIILLMIIFGLFMAYKEVNK